MKLAGSDGRRRCRDDDVLDFRRSFVDSVHAATAQALRAIQTGQLVDEQGHNRMAVDPFGSLPLFVGFVPQRRHGLVERMDDA